jgi:two-component system, NtrC family, response regulator AtoC
VEPTKSHILVVDEEADLKHLIVEHLTLEGFEVDAASSAEEATEKLSRTTFDVVVTDLMLPGKSGVVLLEETLARSPETIVIMMTGDATIETAVEAMKKGAYNYLGKPIELPIMIRRGLKESNLRHENQYLHNQLQERFSFHNIIGTGPAMHRVFELVEAVAGLTNTCLIEGETGTGKELIAKAIHFNGPRRNQKLISTNCGAIPEQLLESELFGHTKGAIAGAVQTRIGRFEQADRGTMFLDEIGSMPLSLQVKLLRVLQDREFECVGGSETVKVDVRIIAATSVNLERMVAQGTFREDLYYRLNVIPISLPPLRERREDIPLLVQEFVKHLCERHKLENKSVSPQVMNALMAFDWPGNVRQLENVVERMVALTGTRNSILPADLPSHLENKSRLAASAFIELPEEGINFQSVVTGMERQLIVQSLKRTNGNKKLAAKLLSLKRTTLIEKIKRIGLDEPVSTSV